MIIEDKTQNVMKQEYWLNIAKREIDKGQKIERVKRIIQLCADDDTANKVINFIKS